MEADSGSVDHDRKIDAATTSPWFRCPDGLLDQVLTEFSARWNTGDRRGVEIELERYPSLAADPSAAAELVYREFELRCQEGEAVSLKDFQQKYPAYSHAIARFAVAAEMVAIVPSRIGPGARFGRYRIDAEIGRGGMGIVFRAYDSVLDRVVALKVIRSGLTAGDDEVLRLKTEAMAAAQLEHPNIVDVHEIGEIQGYVYLSLRYVDGLSLANRVRDFRDAPRKAACLVEAIARAVHHAHQRGVLHRDLKPANILVDSAGVPYVADFGLAKRLDQPGAMTQSGDIIGTPSYMPPEQAQGRSKAVTTASDVYGLGAVLYELLTGHAPFRGDDYAQTIRQVIEHEPKRPASLNPSVSRDLQTICLKCLEKDPARRYPSAGALAADLNRWLAGEPIQARPVGWIERIGKWAWRKPTVAALVATLSLVFFVGLPGFLAYYLWNAGRWEKARIDEAAREASNSARIDEAIKTHLEARYGALTSQVSQSLGPSRRYGWRSVAIKDVGDAGLIPALRRNLVELRSLAARCIVGVDLAETGVIAEKLSAWCVAFSPDGKRVALGQGKGVPWFSVRVYDPESRTLLWERRVNRLGRMNESGIRSLCFSPDGRWLAAGTRFGSVYVWENVRDRPVPTVLLAHQGTVNSLSFVGPTILLSAGDNRLRLWTLGEGSRWQSRSDLALDKPADELVLGRNGTMVVCVGLEMRIVGTSDLLEKTGQKDVVRKLPLFGNHVALSPDGRNAATSDHGRITVSGLLGGGIETQRVFHEPELENAHEGSIDHLEFSPDGAILASSSDGTVKLWEVASGRPLLSVSLDGLGHVYPSFSPDGKTLVVATEEKTLIYDVMRTDHQRNLGHDPRAIRAFTFTSKGPQGENIACVTETRDNTTHTEVVRWDMRSGKPPEVLPSDLPPHVRMTVETVAASHPRTPTLALNRPDGILLWDDQRPGSIRRIPVRHPSSMMFSPDGTRLWAVIEEKTQVAAWNSDRLVQAVKPWSNVVSRLFSAQYGLTCLHAGNRWVLVGSNDGLTYLLRASDGQLESRWPSDETQVECVALNGDESLAVIGTRKGTVQVVRVPTGEVAGKLENHDERLTAVAFSGDGRYLVAGSRDGTTWVYRITGGSFEPVLRLDAHRRPVRAIRFRPESGRLGVLLENEHAVRVWDLDKLRTTLGEVGLAWE